MKDYTFGNYRSAQILTELLNATSKNVQNKVCNSLARYKEELIQLKLIKDKRFKLNLLFNRKKYYLELIKKFIIDEKLQHYINNVIVTWYRKELKGD